ncbi:MAG: hypothetical protein WAN35_19980 [Terracidiphilus sp.]|jgi:hypothetical protein
MKINPSYLANSKPLTEEEKAARAQAEEEAKAKRQAAIEMQVEAEARANGATVSLSDKSLSALALDDQRVRRNIQWGIVRGMFLYTLFMIPVAIIFGLIVAGSR